MFNTAKEIHIAIDTKLQELSSDRKRAFRDEQVDFIFNYVMLRYVNDSIVPYKSKFGLPFFYDVNKAVKIQSLLSTLNFPISSNGLFLVNVPYLYPISVSLHYLPCAVGSVEEVAHDTYVSVLPFPDLSNPADYSNLKITVTDNNGVVTELYNNSKYNITLYASDAKFILVNNVLNERNSTYSVFWENYITEYHNNSFIIVSTKPFKEATIKYGSVNIPVAPYVNTQTIGATNDKLSSDSAIVTFDNSIMSNNYYYKEANHLVGFSNNELKVLSTKHKYISADLTYVRHPRLMSIKTNTIPDIPNAINDIINATVSEMIAILSGSVNYIQLLTKDSE